KTPPTERSRLLHALADAIQANRKELAELEVRNVGKAISSVKAELAQGVENFRFYASAIGSIAGRSNPIGGSLLFYSLKEPVGVVGQIVPWNYPLMMTTWKLAPALAAGCSVVLKPDSATPLTALRIAELATEVGFPSGAINVVPGPGTTVGAHLVRHPRVDKIAFTGSTATGGEIMRLASDTIKRLTLELGGKSPNIVFADANLEDAIPSSVWSIYYSAGQSCEARSRVLVEAPLYDEFVSSFSEAAKRLRVGDPLEPETQVGSLISAEHRDKVHGFVERGRAEGDRLDARSRSWAPPGAATQSGHGRDQHALHRLPRNSVRRLQAIRVRPRAGAGDARALPGDEERSRLDQPEAVQPVRSIAQRYRWAVLAAGTVAQSSFSAVLLGLPVLAPTLRAELDLSVSEVGIVLGSVWVGPVPTLLPWGLAADRVGERAVLAVGLALMGALVSAAAFVSNAVGLVVGLGIASAAGA